MRYEYRGVEPGPASGGSANLTPTDAINLDAISNHGEFAEEQIRPQLVTIVRSGAAMSRARPNVVLLMIDDLRADMASAPTPHIDRLAAHSVEFTEAHAQVLAEHRPSRSAPCRVH